MTHYEILSFHAEVFAKLEVAGVQTSDFNYLPLYEDYICLLSQGNKVSYVVSLLSERYGVCERTIYAVIKRMQRTCITQPTTALDNEQ